MARGIGLVLVLAVVAASVLSGCGQEAPEGTASVAAVAGSEQSPAGVDNRGTAALEPTPASKEPSTMDFRSGEIPLPAPSLDGTLSVERALSGRRSVRDFASAALSLDDISQLLWSVQGTNRPGGYRTAPSAGALYPLEVFVAAGDVSGLAAGVYRYHPDAHFIEPVKEGDPRRELYDAALQQEAVLDAPASIAITAIYERTTGKYGDRGRSYVHMEVGAAAENAYLQAEALGLGTVFIGAFEDDRIQRALGARSDERPLCILPVGVPDSTP